jgi:hypothetical protein
MINDEDTPRTFVIQTFGFISSFVIHFIPHSFFLSPRPSMRIFSHKICCDVPQARLVGSKFFKIVLGGTAALHAYRVWGAVIF